MPFSVFSLKCFKTTRFQYDFYVHNIISLLIDSLALLIFYILVKVDWWRGMSVLFPLIIFEAPLVFSAVLNSYLTGQAYTKLSEVNKVKWYDRAILVFQIIHLSFAIFFVGLCILILINFLIKIPK